MKHALLALALAMSLTGGSGTVAQPREAPAATAGSSLYLLHLRPGPAWREGRPMQEQDLRAHAIYHRDLVRDGRSFAAGGYGGVDGGMAIIRAANAAEAQAVLAADPAITSGVFIGEVRAWTPSFHAPGPLVEARP